MIMTNILPSTALLVRYAANHGLLTLALPAGGAISVPVSAFPDLGRLSREALESVHLDKDQLMLEFKDSSFTISVKDVLIAALASTVEKPAIEQSPKTTKQAQEPEVSSSHPPSKTTQDVVHQTVPQPVPQSVPPVIPQTPTQPTDMKETTMNQDTLAPVAEVETEVEMTTEVQAETMAEPMKVAKVPKEPKVKKVLAPGEKRERIYSRKLVPHAVAIVKARTEDKRSIADIALEYKVAPIDIRLVLKENGIVGKVG